MKFLGNISEFDLKHANFFTIEKVTSELGRIGW